MTGRLPVTPRPGPVVDRDVTRRRLRCGWVGLWSLLLMAVGVGTSATAAASGQPTAGLPGHIAYVVDSDFYSNNAKDTLALTAADGSPGPRVLISKKAVDIGLLALSPDGQQLAYFSGTETAAAIDVMTVATKQVTVPFKLRGKKGFIDGLAWSADGTGLVVGTNEHPGTSRTHKETALWSIPVTGAGSATRLTPFEDAGSPDVSASGELFYVVSASYSSSTLHKSALWTSDATGASPRIVYSSSHLLQSPAPDPTGQTVVVEVVDSQTSSHLESITLTAMTGSDLTPAVKGRSDVQPTWSPDGSHIAFLSSRAGRHASTAAEQYLDAYVMTASGDDVKELIGFGSGTKSVGAIDWGT